MSDLHACARCGESFAPPAEAKGTARSWCRPCRRTYMRDYMRRYGERNPKYWRKYHKSACGRCNGVLVLGRCIAGCREQVASRGPVIRVRRCSICGNGFVLPIGALGNVRTCSSAMCHIARHAMKNAAKVGMTGKQKARLKKKKPHHTGSYARHAAMVRAAANADPNTKCWRCGLTLAEHPPQRNGKPARWTAGHVIDGQIGGELRPEASVCNMSAGAAHGNRLREPHTERF